MFEDYRNQVLSDYQKKKTEGKLSLFEHITPANLKREFVNILKERKGYDSDLHALRSFFGPNERGKGYAKIIEDRPTPDFRALSDFFRANKNPDRTNTELLAWLIDFQPRPYQAKDAYIVSDSTKPNTESGEVKESNLSPANQQEVLATEEVNLVEEEQVYDQEKEDIPKVVDDSTKTTSLESRGILGIPKKYYRTVGAFTASLFVITIAYFFFDRGNKKCMYWAGDRYVKVACDAKILHTIILDLDTFKLTHFRKITRPDTLTKDDLGKVWRSKKNGKVDFFTDSGTNPTDTSLRLLPLSAYMLDKYGHVVN